VPLSTLCLHCGLCCDGNLFTHVGLTPPEAEGLRRAGFEVKERADGTRALEQRCAALDGKCCTVYAQRPASCRRYHCQLASALSEGEVALEEALAAVDEAHAALRAVEAVLPEAAGSERGGAVMQRARRAAQQGELSPEARAAWERAEAVLDRHFRGRTRQHG
jgi:uncharacterized protein